MLNKTKKFSGFAAWLCLSACNSIIMPEPAEAAHRGNPSGSTPGALRVYATCTVPPTSYSGTIKYVDPVSGNNANPGTAGSPWATLDYGAINVGSNNTLELYSGTYPAAAILGVQNTSFSRIIPVPGNTPIITSLNMQGAKKWVIQGLTFQSLNNGNEPLLTVSGEATHGQSSDIVVNNNLFQSGNDATIQVMTAPQFLANGRYAAIQYDGGDTSSTYAHCFAATGNTIKNVAFGLQITGDYALVDANTISYTGNDMIDFAGSKITISNNYEYNSVYNGSGLHNDGIQGQCGHGFCGTGIGLGAAYDTLLIDSNIFIDRIVPKASLPLFTDGPDGTQGIDDTDSDWTNVTVINNIVVGTATILIEMSSIHNGKISNNTVFNTHLNAGADYSGGVYLRSISHNGNLSDHVIVNNNLTDHLGDDDQGGGATQGNSTFNNNLVTNRIDWWAAPAGSASFNSTPGTIGSANAITATSQFTGMFVSTDTTNGVYDLHLQGGSPAKNFGSITNAPACTDGTARGANPDAGAYC